ncbi:hypothetical protein BV509_08355 [Rhodovulum sulfidophilum]|uniref:Tripartite tricarboxylate transporter TctB family protein n=1 Tax=Rhodovulum visakhapatnamense TaxID=364297 RepID=A0ABS1RFY7_9RHOB|nr:tripartite tricarboxylate transporter TctB family protein [Rhodovulum visakhapatnamense]MBL3569170.1 tripartite tricarboxylate transporter TctB family protein [Rhodovulum visakhapatnamense]MBL3578054.1 tripartite tricarboxylate transporter TctB family protein [Rhodovulum visakhapatnamense]OLS44352.1 hypothetical protein BV509_08355 [Rhodovulum sulfidophilum]
MVDRIFAGLLLAVTLGYGWLAFTVIRAPFQYDPLGPESWPRILSVLAALCLAGILWKPDVDRFDTRGGTWLRLAAIVALLVGYAGLYEPLGFVLATLLFGTIAARLLGATLVRAGLFGLATGVLGYLLCAGLLDLNLPEGPLPRL